MDKAFARSCSGSGAAGWLQVPSAEDHYLEDEDFHQALLFRLRQPRPSACASCQHWNHSAQTPCGRPLDPRGDHASMCLAGGHAVRRHNALVQTLAKLLAQGPLNVVDVEPVTPTERPGQPGARPGLAWKLPGQQRRMADVQVTSSHTQRPYIRPPRQSRMAARHSWQSSTSAISGGHRMCCQ